MLEPRKCLHLYHYFMHEEFGLCHVRVQTWFPFQVDVCLNGRAWLARQMDRAGLGYRQRDNTFVWLEDAASAQRLLDEQVRTRWPAVLRGLLEVAHPLHREICRLDRAGLLLDGQRQRVCHRRDVPRCGEPRGDLSAAGPSRAAHFFQSRCDALPRPQDHGQRAGAGRLRRRSHQRPQNAARRRAGQTPREGQLGEDG